MVLCIGNIFICYICIFVLRNTFAKWCVDNRSSVKTHLKSNSSKYLPCIIEYSF